METNGNGSVLTSDVVLMDLNVSVWTGRVKLNPEDIGKTASEIPEDFYLGHKALVPKKVVKKIKGMESRGRSVLEKWGYSFPIGQTRAIPVGVVPEVVKRLQAVKDEFDGLAEEFAANFLTYREATIEKYGEALRPFYPSESSVRGRFSFDWVMVTIKLPHGEGTDENAAKVKKVVEGWIDEIGVQMRDAASSIFAKVADKLAKSEAVSERSFNSIRKSIERFRAINFLKDATVESKLREAMDLLNANNAADCRENPTVAASLGSALNTIMGQIADTSDLDAVTGGYKRRLRL